MLPPPRRFAFALAILLSMVGAGCVGGCASQTVPTQVELALMDEEVRTLPILASGRSSVGGIDFPDAYGRLEVAVGVSHRGSTNASLNFDDIDVQDLRLTLVVEKRTLPVEILGIDGADRWDGDHEAGWRGRVTSGERLVVWWRMPYDLSRSPPEVLLPEGASYGITVDFDWKHDDCIVRASGHLTQGFNDFVQASVNAKALEPAGDARLEISAAGAVGLAWDLRVRSGHDLAIRSLDVKAIHVGRTGVGAAVEATPPLEGASGSGAAVNASLPLVSLVAFPHMAVAVDGHATERVTPWKPLTLRSTTPTGGAYGTTGRAVPPIASQGPSVWIVVARVGYVSEDPTIGATTDVLAGAIVSR